jgi:4-hydroxybenzoyl-CoA thioesterase
MAFRTEIQVRFGDEDHAGIVYFPRFLHFFHCAFEDFFAAHGHPYKQVLDDDGTGWPAVHVETSFHSPLRFGDVFEVTVDVERLGTKSATFRYRGRRREDGQDVASARITVACIDMKTFRAKPIPEVYRRIFEGHLGRSDETS